MLYSSPEFAIARNEAGHVLRAALNEEMDNSWVGLHHRLKTTGDWEKLSTVDNFFRSIYFLSQEKLIDKKLSKALFKEFHNHWHRSYFSSIDKASIENGTSTGTQSKLNQWLNET